MLCTNKKCRREFDDSFKFCPYCGKPKVAPKKPHRSRGTGTIIRRKDNKSAPYEARLPAVTDKNGHVIREVLGHYATMQEAREALSEWSKAPTQRVNWTIEDVFNAWKQVGYKGLSKSAIDGYNACWYKLRSIAKTKIRDIKTAELQSIIDYYENPHHKELQGCKLAYDTKTNSPIVCDGLSFSSISKIKALMTLLYKYAMQEDIVTKNYALFVKITPKENSVKERFTDVQVKIIENNVNKIPYADYILAMCYTGFRVSEFLELTRESYHNNGIPVLVGGSKTDAGTDRIVPIHPKIKQIVENCIARNGETIFCDTNGNAIRPDYFREYCFKPALKAMGLPVYSCHATRRTFSTRLSAANARQEDMIALMGHTDFSVDVEHYIIQEAKTLYNAILKIS